MDKKKSNKNQLSILSAIGSVASLSALVIVLIDKGTKEPQVAIWRMALALIGLLVCGATGVIVYDYLFNKVFPGKDNLRIKALKALIVLIPAILVIAICLDGIFAAINWRWWLSDILKIF
jgi:hypothetical protein